MGYIKLADGLCRKCNDGKLKPVIGKREKQLCIYHWKSDHRRSPKGKSDDMIYSDLKREYLSDKPHCQIAIHGICTYHAVDIHHDEGHIGHYLDVSTWIGTCRLCHRYIEDHPQFAYDNGFAKKRVPQKLKSEINF